MCQASLCGFSHAAGRYGDTRIGSKSGKRVQKTLQIPLGLLIPIRSIICPCGSLPSSHKPGVVAAFCLSGHSDFSSAYFTFCQHCPDAPGHLVCQSNRNKHARLSGEHACQSRSLSRGLARRPTYSSHRPDDQQSADIALPHLRGSTENLPTSPRMLQRD